MSKTLDLGRRIELHPMDVHCHNISLGLYRREVGGLSAFVVHTYGSVEGARQRVKFLTRALMHMVGLEEVPDCPNWLQFPCKSDHQRALRRAFLDLCKLKSDALLEPKPLRVFDKKADCHLSAVHLGDGAYQMESEEPTDAGTKRAVALARGFIKLCEIEPVEGTDARVAFPCRANHDAMIGMLMYRAQNVRAAMQEDEMAASRGVLAPPSQQ